LHKKGRIGSKKATDENESILCVAAKNSSIIFATNDTSHIIKFVLAVCIPFPKCEYARCEEYSCHDQTRSTCKFSELLFGDQTYRARHPSTAMHFG
jgi:hypothetical protein